MGNGTVQHNTTDADITYIATGVGVAGGLLIAAVMIGVGVVIFMRFKHVNVTEDCVAS